MSNEIVLNADDIGNVEGATHLEETVPEMQQILDIDSSESIPRTEDPSVVGHSSQSDWSGNSRFYGNLLIYPVNFKLPDEDIRTRRPLKIQIIKVTLCTFEAGHK